MEVVLLYGWQEIPFSLTRFLFSEIIFAFINLQTKNYVGLFYIESSNPNRSYKESNRSEGNLSSDRMSVISYIRSDKHLTLKLRSVLKC